MQHSTYKRNKYNYIYHQTYQILIPTAVTSYLMLLNLLENTIGEKF